jgi:hypothetical protein
MGDKASIVAGGFADEANWGEPVVLEGANFDVSYLEREENGRTQGYWVMPNGGNILVGKAKGGAGVVPLLDGPLSTIYTTRQPWERGKQAPTPPDTNEGADQAVVEAPFMTAHAGRIYLTYSGGTVDKYYSLGLLTAAGDANLLASAPTRRPRRRRSPERVTTPSSRMPTAISCWPTTPVPTPTRTPSPTRPGPAASSTPTATRGSSR